jgi:hypothetical protein
MCLATCQSQDFASQDHVHPYFNRKEQLLVKMIVRDDDRLQHVAALIMIFEIDLEGHTRQSNSPEAEPNFDNELATMES